MRKHSVRKWIHAILDMLPLVVIPIFAIYSHRHVIDTYSVTREEPLTVNAYQYVENYTPITFNGWKNYDNVYVTTIGGYNNTFFDFIGEGEVYLDNFTSIAEHVYFVSFYSFANSVNTETYLDVMFNGDSVNVPLTTTYSKYYVNIVSPSFDDNRTLGFYGYDSSNDDIYLQYINLFDLTSIFGSGNEPSADIFNSYLTFDYYSFGNNSLVLGTHNVTYNDTDIGSQFMYQMYNVTNKYFNFNKVGTFQDIYNWFDNNLFGGASPMSFFIVWNIILYEFIMDLIFLTYMLFMFIIDFAEHMIDCFFDKSYRGGR